MFRLGIDEIVGSQMVSYHCKKAASLALGTYNTSPIKRSDQYDAKIRQ